jgi:hypothetical protein
MTRETFLFEMARELFEVPGLLAGDAGSGVRSLGGTKKMRWTRSALSERAEELRVDGVRRFPAELLPEYRFAEGQKVIPLASERARTDSVDDFSEHAVTPRENPHLADELRSAPPSIDHESTLFASMANIISKHGRMLSTFDGSGIDAGAGVSAAAFAGAGVRENRSLDIVGSFQRSP